MQKENHRDWVMVSRACCRIDPTEPTVLIVEPQDYAFREQIAAAGVSLVPKDDPTPIPPAYPDEEQRPLTSKDFFNNGQGYSKKNG
jgi:hypothetical protein